MQKLKKLLAKWLVEERDPYVRVDIKCPHNNFVEAHYFLNDNKEGAHLSCDECPLHVRLTFGDGTPPDYPERKVRESKHYGGQEA